MKNYIVVLVNELRHVLASELSWKANTYISSEETMRGLMATAFEKEES